MKVICQDQIRKAESFAPEKRAVTSVAADIDRLLSPKTYDELVTLEKQIRRKLDSNEPVDTDYWEQLLKSLSVWKARAKLKRVYSAVIKNRVDELRKQQQEEADSVRKKLAPLAPYRGPRSSQQEIEQVALLDPEPLLQLRSQDKNLEVMDEEELLNHVVCIHSPDSILYLRLTPSRPKKERKL